MRFIFYLWPALIPIILYIGWLIIVRQKIKKRAIESEVLPGLKDGPWVWTLLASVAIAIFCFLFLGLASDRMEGQYQPAQYIDGKLIDGKSK